MAIMYGSSCQASDLTSDVGPLDPEEIPMPQFVRKDANRISECGAMADGYSLFGKDGCTSSDSRTQPSDSGAIADVVTVASSDSRGSDAFALDGFHDASLASRQEKLSVHDVAHCGFAGSDELPIEWQGKTSVLVKNVPYRFTQEMLYEELRMAGFEGTFDYLYLPVNRLRKAKGKGYAFLNFISAPIAYRFKCAFDAHCLQDASGRESKPLIIIPANLQGYDDNVAHHKVVKASKQEDAEAESDIHCAVVDPYEVLASDDFLAAARLENWQQVESSSGSLNRPSRNRTRARGSLSDGGNLKALACPKCGGRVAPKFRFCQMCGASLSKT
eukprot:TRINITY_DN18383_c0_g1_i1.p1 TRINITY_DN18383_c0_g1~~TRINITY_DN18383_c0_g1_i1.p1  ORF type:complete len:377 (+),score=61.24 TRINITY_DN18383_c0_g1_i1:144-1133(+)